MKLTWYHKFLMAFAFICAIALLSPKADAGEIIGKPKVHSTEFNVCVAAAINQGAHSTVFTDKLYIGKIHEDGYHIMITCLKETNQMVLSSFLDSKEEEDNG